jgi:hypothetical protein
LFSTTSTSISATTLGVGNNLSGDEERPPHNTELPSRSCDAGDNTE